MKHYFLMIGVVTLLAACKKEERPASVVTQSKTHTVINAVNDPAANPLNPYDDAGRAHNKGLSFVLTHIRSIDRSKVDEVLKVTSQYATDSLKSSLPTDATTAVKELIADDKNQYENEISHSKLSETGKQYAHVLVKIFAGDRGRSFEQLKSTIVALESNVLADKALSTADRQSLLSASSVARYSLYYWMHSTAQPAQFNIFIAAHDVVGTLMFGFSFGTFASAAARAVVTQNWAFFVYM